MKVLALLIILVAIFIVIVPQFTNCEDGKDAEIVAGVPPLAIGVFTILVPTTIVGTCASGQMVCSREMKRENGAGGATPA